MEFHHVEQQEQEDDEDMPLPLNTTYGHNHIVPLSLHHHKPPGSTTLPPPPAAAAASMVVNVKYKECLRNHAASMGGKARDGCGEFMALGEEGTLEALTCSVCNCHRNFHRKEVEADNHHRHYATATTSYDDHHHPVAPTHLGNGRNLILQGPPPPMIMPYSIGLGMGSFPMESDSLENGGGGGGQFMSMYPAPPPAPPAAQRVKKRFRTKFTQEQKERMYKFAEKSGWKIQRQEDSVVEEFCQEIGIKRRVLKVWMHNNKQNLAKNTNSISINNPPQNPN